MWPRPPSPARCGGNARTDASSTTAATSSTTTATSSSTPRATAGSPHTHGIDPMTVPLLPIWTAATSLPPSAVFSGGTSEEKSMVAGARGGLDLGWCWSTEEDSLDLLQCSRRRLHHFTGHCCWPRQLGCCESNNTRNIKSCRSNRSFSQG